VDIGSVYGSYIKIKPPRYQILEKG